MNALGGIVWWKAVSKTPTWGTPGSSTSQASMPLRLAGLWSGANWMHFRIGGLDLVRDQDRGGEILAAVDDPVADAVDLGLVLDDPVLGVQEEGQDHLDGDRVVRDLADLADLVLALGLVGDDRVARADLLDDALGQEALVLHPHELELDRGTAAVQNEHFHEFTILLSRTRSRRGQGAGTERQAALEPMMASWNQYKLLQSNKM